MSQPGCTKCGNHVGETYEFDMPADNALPLEELAPAKCADCGAAIQERLDRRQQVQ